MFSVVCFLEFLPVFRVPVIQYDFIRLDCATTVTNESINSASTARFRFGLIFFVA